MLNFLILSNFRTVFQDHEINKDYNMRISFKPETESEREFGEKYGFILYPHLFGLIDTTINSDDYNCIIIYDSNSQRIMGTTQPIFPFIIKKLKNIPEQIVPKEPSKLSQSNEEKMGNKFRSLKGPTGNTSVNLGEDSVELVAGENKIIISSNGISIYGNVTEYNLLSKSLGGLFKETEIFRLLPKAFVPPFCIPDYLPNMELLNKVAIIVQTVKSIQEAFSSV